MFIYIKIYKYLFIINVLVYLNFIDLIDENDEEMKILNFYVEFLKG